MNQWKTRPEQAEILCDFSHCAYGMGQAGAGRCPGDWTDPNCKEFITDEDFEKQMTGYSRKVPARAHRKGE